MSTATLKKLDGTPTIKQGRPPTLTETLIKKLGKLIAEKGMSVHGAGAALGINQRTLKSWITSSNKKYARGLFVTFRTQMEDSKAIYLGKLEAAAFELAISGDRQMIMWLLKTRYPETYGEKNEQTVKIESPEPIQQLPYIPSNLTEIQNIDQPTFSDERD